LRRHLFAAFFLCSFAGWRAWAFGEDAGGEGCAELLEELTHGRVLALPLEGAVDLPPRPRRR
jgi:hypothetical protein